MIGFGVSPSTEMVPGSTGSAAAAAKPPAQTARTRPKRIRVFKAATGYADMRGAGNFSLTHRRFSIQSHMGEITTALTFDDVLLLPALSSVLPAETDLSTRLTRSISLNIP